MTVGLYQNTAALAALERWQQASSHNISASQVPGFKRQLVQFSAQPSGELRTGQFKSDESLSGSFPSARVRFDFAPGEMVQTRRDLDVAISGDGFLSVRLPDGREGFTRAGQLSVRADRTLVTADNLPVLGAGRAPIILQAGGAIAIDADGEISQAGQVVDTLAVSRFADPQKLEPLSGGVFLPTADEAPIAVAGGSSVMQGYIEGSNISPMREMIDLVSIARAYEANQKIISTRDQLLQRTLDTLG
jgi:flagellar basal body rod protein FlgG